MTKISQVLTLLTVVAVGAGSASVGFSQGGGQGRGGGRGPAVPPIIMTTTAFEDGGVIPAKFVGQMGVSPEFKWSQIPPNTQSLVLLMHDTEPSLNRTLLDVMHCLIWKMTAAIM